MFSKIFLLILLFVPQSLFAHVDAMASLILQAYARHEPIPTLSHQYAIDMSSAYLVQAAVVKERSKKDKIAGFKAGLTSQDAQSYFKINRPIFGVLFESGDFSEKTDIALFKFHHLMVETELGFITKKPIRKIVQSVDELKSYIGQIVPVVELPEVGFSKDPIAAADLIAGNTGRGGYIINKKINWIDQNVNLITASLLHNGRIINQGQGVDALGDQWEALRWLVNQVIAQGWKIEKGHLLITGALGEMLPAQIGTYQAKFNNTAVLDFKFTE